MLIIPALALLLAFGILLTAVLRPPTRAAALLSVYLLSYANIVLVGEISNSLIQLNNRWLFIALHLVLAAAAWFIWRRSGCPSLRAPWSGPDGRVIPCGLRASLKRWPDLWLLGAGVGIAFLFSAVLIWVVPPNNNDSLATHMSRIGYWLQHGSFFPWSTHRIWQITYPVNMQLQMFWTALFLGSDRIVEIVQWLGALAAIPAAYGLARLLGASRPQASFAALILCTFPAIILESTTTQNDLVAGTLFAAMMYLLFLGLYRNHTGMLALSGLALGLGIGTKQTLFFLLPGLALAVGVVLIYCGRKSLNNLMTWALSGVAAFILVGAYMFIVNQVNFGHPMGPETAVESQTVGMTGQSLADNLKFNVFRLVYQSIDPTGLPDPLAGYSFKAKGRITRAVVNALHYPVESAAAVTPGYQFDLLHRYVVQEDAAWYGPLLALLVLPALLYQTYKGIKRKDPLRAAIFILSFTFLIINAALRPGWDPFQGRYFIPVVMISVPMIAFLVKPGKRWATLRWAVVFIALTVAANTFLLNSGKPVTGERTVWNMSRVDMQTLQSFYMRGPIKMIESVVPADATLGLVATGRYLEYPLFGEQFSRHLVQIDPPERAGDIRWLKSQGIEYVVLQQAGSEMQVKIPEVLVPIASLEDWTVYSWAVR